MDVVKLIYWSNTKFNEQYSDENKYYVDSRPSADETRHKLRRGLADLRNGGNGLLKLQNNNAPDNKKSGKPPNERVPVYNHERTTDPTWSFRVVSREASQS